MIQFHLRDITDPRSSHIRYLKLSLLRAAKVALLVALGVLALIHLF
jgi:hypothetical protein